MYTQSSVDRILSQYGIEGVELLGYSYLSEAILLILDDVGLNEQRRITDVYREIALRHCTSWKMVELHIRNLLRRFNCKMMAGSFIFHVVDALYFTHSNKN